MPPNPVGQGSLSKSQQNGAEKRSRDDVDGDSRQVKREKPSGEDDDEEMELEDDDDTDGAQKATPAGTVS